MFTLDKNTNVKDYLVTLNNDYRIPLVNFGTFCISGSVDIQYVLDVSLQAGYRGFDTAHAYQNESDIGAALKHLLLKYGLKREDIFLTTKLSPSKFGNEDVVKAEVKKSLEKLGAGYIDLYLIHWPGSNGIHTRQARSITWRTLVNLHDGGKGPLKAIGVSNFTARHLKELFEDNDFPPAVNQVEFHPHWKHDDELKEICSRHKILLQAYSPLGGGQNTSLLKNPDIRKIAEKYHITSAQVLLRWALQRGYAIVVKSKKENRIIGNIDLNRALDSDDMRIINDINVRKKYAWNPETLP